MPQGVSPGQTFTVVVPAAAAAAAPATAVPIVQGTWLDPGGNTAEGLPAFIQAAVRVTEHHLYHILLFAVFLGLCQAEKLDDTGRESKTRRPTS